MSDLPIEEKLEQDEFEELIHTGRYFKEFEFLKSYQRTQIQMLVAIERLRRAVLER